MARDAASSKPKETTRQKERSEPAASERSSDDPNRRTLERIFGGASLKQVQNFCNRTAMGMHAGVDILRILETEAKVGSQRYKDACRDTAQRIREGYSLADAMRMQGDFFPSMLVKMVEAGEHSGQIDRTMRFMSEYYLDLKRTRQDFISQITTPVIQLLAAIAIICGLIFLNGFLFKAGAPGEEPFDLTGVGLRGVPGVLIFLSIVLGIGAVVGTTAFGIWKNWFNCHNILVPLVRNIPVIGPVFTQTAMARLSMTMSMMLGAGVDAKRSVREALLSTGNHYYMSGLPLTLQEVERGTSLADSLAAPGVLPEDFIQAVEIGEMSGSDSESLERMAVVYREKAQLALKQLAISAGFAIWLMIAAMIIAVIFIIFTQYLNILYGNLPK
ncbi:MAG: type II secretion system F family protein [Planctomycetota bacterium]|jgi:type IV pilus assembly protein PilC